MQFIRGRMARVHLSKVMTFNNKFYFAKEEEKGGKAGKGKKEEEVVEEVP